MENRKAVLYLEVLKAIYGCLQSALLFYLKLKKDLESVGFELNPYNPCIANKVIKGKQITIYWHVDDIKASHKESKVIDKFVQWLRDKYKEKDIGKLKAARGKKHTYLGIDLDYSKPGKVSLSMIKYVKEIIEAFPNQEEIKKKATTPAAPHLFQVREVKKLDKDKAKIFHHIVAKGLFLCTRSRVDIQPTIAF